jgi:hypothetical protein
LRGARADRDADHDDRANINDGTGCASITGDSVDDHHDHDTTHPAVILIIPGDDAMTKYLLASAFGLAMMTGGVLAQGAASDPTAIYPNGPAGSERITKTQRTIDSDGTVIDKTQTYDKSQTYTGDDGELSAHSSTSKTEQTTVTAPPPPPPLSTTTTTTTTTEETRQ